MFPPAGLLVPVEVVINQHPAELDGSCGSRAGMEVEQDIEPISAGVAHGFDALDGTLQHGRGSTGR